jgi:O-antigen/teichoic acid export membrane protein
MAEDEALDQQPPVLETGAEVTTLAKGGAIQIAGVIANRGLAFVLVAVAVRLLGLARYGLLREVTQILNIVGLLAPGGLQWAAVRFIAQARALKDYPAVRGTVRVTLVGSAVVSTALAVGIVLAAEPIARAFHQTPEQTVQMANLLRIGALFIPLYALMTVLRNIAQAYKAMMPSVIVGNIVQPATFVVFSVVALALGLAVRGVVMSLVLSAAVATMLGIWFYQRLLRPEEREATPRSDVGAILKFGLPQAGSNLFSIQALGLGVVIVGLFRDEREVGLIAIALSLQALGNVFLTGMFNIWAPVVSSLYAKGQMDRLSSLYQTVNRWAATFAVPVLTVLILEPRLFLRILAGRSGPAAAGLVMILAAGNLFYVGTGPGGLLLSMTGRPGLNFLNSFLAVASYVGFGILVVPRYGAVGMAVVDAGVTAVVNSLRVLEGKFLMGIQPFGRSYLKPIGATLVLAAVLLGSKLLPISGTPVDIVAVVVGGIAYLVVLKLLGLDPEERLVLDRIRSAFLRRGRKAEAPVF